MFKEYINVIIDHREKTRKYDAFSYYKHDPRINHTMIGELPTGDYIFYKKDTEPQNGVVFEYKTIPDFINSVKEGRIFNQSIDQAQEFVYHSVIIVGNDEEELLSGMLFNEEHYYGAIDRLSTYTNVRQVPTQERAFKTMLNTAIKCLENKTLFKKYPKNFGNPASRYLCYNVLGVGEETSLKIQHKLKLQNLDDLFKLDLEKLTSVDGVGEKTAEKILETIKAERTFCEDDEHQTTLI